MQLEAERERRVTHLQNVAARRIGQMELSKGWSAWLEQYQARVRCKQLLAGCTARMAKPRLVACYKVWYHDWDDALKAKSEKGFAVMLSEQTRMRKSVEEQLKELQFVHYQL